MLLRSPPGERSFVCLPFKLVLYYVVTSKLVHMCRRLTHVPVPLDDWAFLFLFFFSFSGVSCSMSWTRQETRTVESRTEPCDNVTAHSPFYLLSFFFASFSLSPWLKQVLAFLPVFTRRRRELFARNEATNKRVQGMSTWMSRFHQLLIGAGGEKILVGCDWMATVAFSLWSQKWDMRDFIFLLVWKRFKVCFSLCLHWTTSIHTPATPWYDTDLSVSPPSFGFHTLSYPLCALIVSQGVRWCLSRECTGWRSPVHCTHTIHWRDY